MISDAACDPEFPPLLMMSGMKSASTTARAISCSKNDMAVAVSISPEEECGEPAAALAHHGAKSDLYVWCVEGFHAAHALDVFRGLFFGDVENVVHGDDAQQQCLRYRPRAARSRS